MTGNGNSIERWKLDKHIPVALLLALGIQTGAGIWWAATIQARQEGATARLELLERAVVNYQVQAIAIAKLETRMGAIQDSLVDMHRMLEAAAGRALNDNRRTPQQQQP